MIFRSAEKLEVGPEVAVGLSRSGVAGQQPDAAAAATRASYTAPPATPLPASCAMSSEAAAGLRYREQGNVLCSTAPTIAGGRRRGGGSLVRTENVSNDAWPQRPSRLPRTHSAVSDLR